MIARGISICADYRQAAKKTVFKFPAVFDHCLLMNINELCADSLRINKNGVDGYQDRFLCRLWSHLRYFCIRNAFSALFFLLVNGK